MCRDCSHWKRREMFTSHGLQFAPCTLKPDRMVTDKRDPRGVVEQAYVMQDSYACGRFEKRTN